MTITAFRTSSRSLARTSAGLALLALLALVPAGCELIAGTKSRKVSTAGALGNDGGSGNDGAAGLDVGLPWDGPHGGEIPGTAGTTGTGGIDGTGGVVTTGGRVAVDGGPDLPGDTSLAGKTGGSAGGATGGGMTVSSGTTSAGGTGTGGMGTGGAGTIGRTTTGGGPGGGGTTGTGDATSVADAGGAETGMLADALDAAGSVNHAVELAGSQFSYVDVGAVTIPADFTIELWVKVAAVQPTGTEQRIIAKDADTVGENQFRLALRDGYIAFMMADPTGQDGGLWGGTNYILRTADPVATEVWLHIAVTKAGKAFVLYLNGASQTVFSTTVTLSHAGAVPMRFGGRHETKDSDWFHGAIDEVRLWNVARSATDIQSDMGRSIASSRADFTSLVGYWKFDEGAGSTTADARGTWNGVLSSVSWLTPGAPLQ